MDTVDPIRVILALAFVLSLIGALAWLAKRYGFGNFALRQQTGGRLQVLETRYIDAKRKLVLISRDGNEHLLLCTGDHDTVIETGIRNDEQ